MANRARDTAEQLRHDIDSGRTGDKIPAADPATAPLGTDDEAAGTRARPDWVALARRIETSGPQLVPERHSGLGHTWIVVAIIAALAVVLVVAGLSLTS
jgi:hypothetical protein